MAKALRFAPPPKDESFERRSASRNILYSERLPTINNNEAARASGAKKEQKKM